MRTIASTSNDGQRTLGFLVIGAIAAGLIVLAATTVLPSVDPAGPLAESGGSAGGGGGDAAGGGTADAPRAGGSPAPEEPAASEAAPTSTWTVDRRSTGDGNMEAVRAAFVSTASADGFDVECAGTLTWTPYEGTVSTTTFTGAVEPAGFRPLGPLDAAPGDRVFLPDWDTSDGCGGVADFHYVEVTGTAVREFTLGGERLAVEVWTAVVPESEDGYPAGEGRFYWDRATGLLLEASYEGLSGRATTLLVETTERLAYR